MKRFFAALLCVALPAFAGDFVDNPDASVVMNKVDIHPPVGSTVNNLLAADFNGHGSAITDLKTAVVDTRRHSRYSCTAKDTWRRGSHATW